VQQGRLVSRPEQLLAELSLEPALLPALVSVRDHDPQVPSQPL
jgi:hypothetical protein